ncbi:phosphatidylglycerophosphatase A [candidate division KSB1 bacterium]|nr:phosphatidylglycerophosphatase A [candidate division KSB1 bacterium]
MRLISYIFATGFGSGYSPFAPGTAGALLFMVIAGWWLPTIAIGYQIGFCVILFAISVYSSDVVEKDLIKKVGEEKGHDAGMIVIDEMIGVALALVAIPVSPYTLAAAFILFRVFDITKPFPINRLQNLRGGWGITMDDVLAGIFANILIQISRFFL